MKKIITLFAAILIFGFAAQAQFHVISNFGEVEDGSVFEFTGTSHEEAYMSYKLYNDSDEEASFRIKVVSIYNTDGNNIEACLGGLCYYMIIEGATYPTSGGQPSYETIAPGQAQLSDDDHFWNHNETGINPDEPIEVVFAFEKLDQAKLFPVETLSFTYRYSPSMSVDSFEKDLNVRIENTMIRDGKLNVDTKEPVSAEIYNLLGQKVKSFNLNAGQSTVDISNFSAQIYLVRFINNDGRMRTQKIVVE